MNLKSGFTLIELLVVIAIIAILAAIIFPVYARVKDSAYRSSDMSNMNSIRTALQLYKTDQGAYPPALLGYATDYATFKPDNNVIPADMVAQANPQWQNSAFLYPKRINSLETLRPAYDRASNSAVVQAVWPQGTDPQRYGPNDGYVQRCVDLNDGNGPNLQFNYYYAISGYDVETVQIPGSSAKRTELRYAPFWSKNTVPASCNPPDVSGSSSDSPRQLGYSEPPESTVITWNSLYRDYGSNGTLTHNGKREIVLFLGGEARPMDSADVSTQAWQIMP